jgi:cytochrome c nitrite reductase small subunit
MNDGIRKRRRIFAAAGFLLAGLIGVLFGAGTFTFHYAEGLSYFSTNPTSCTNCHIMEPHYDSWLKSSHGNVATCVDCHLPHDFPHNMIAKADNGFNHSWDFTFQSFHEPIQIKPRNARILQNNCIRCHSEMVEPILAHHHPIHRDDTISCVQCHSAVGHTSLPRPH